MDKINQPMTFWDHLEALRWTIMRSLIVIVVCMVGLFTFKEFLFDGIVLAPKNSDFITYRLICALGTRLGFPQMCPGDFSLDLININLSGQFFMHMSIAFWLGFIIAFPYVIYEIWKFIRPALYEKEQKQTLRLFVWGGILFFLGVLVSYFLVFPLTLRFLGAYQVSAVVHNQIALSSYISTLTILTLCMGIMFEMPIVIYFLSCLGLVSKAFLRQYRRWAIVIIMILAAIITPTSDPFTMMVVCAPLFLLYEVSIRVCKE